MSMASTLTRQCVGVQGRAALAVRFELAGGHLQALRACGRACASWPMLRKQAARAIAVAAEALAAWEGER